ncbi:MAG: hypothetical protein R3E66_02090 [bacterium]
MSSRNFAVIVEPHRWQRSTEELARLLEPVIGVSSPVLVSLLLRGPVTVETDLTHLGAQTLVNRLTAMGLPAAVDAPEDVTLQDVPRRIPPAQPQPSNAMHVDDMLAGLGIVDIEIADNLTVDSHFSAPTVESKVEHTPPSQPDVSPPTRRNTSVLGSTPTTKSGGTARSEGEAAGWGALFPDLDAGDPTVQLKPEPATVELVPSQLGPPKPVSLFEDDVSVELPLRGFASAQEPPSSIHIPRENHVDSGPVTSPFGDPPVITPRAIEPMDEAPEPPSPTAVRPLVDAFSGQEDRPPYAPTGFDDRDPHLPQLAMVLSILAPGAGQIYNGDDDDALDYGLRFWTIKPWIASARQAKRRAERIQGFWIPWPKPGSLFRALRYLLFFWIAVGSIVGIITFIVSTALERRIPQETGPTEADKTIAFRDAHVGIVAARIAALDAMAEASQDQRESEYILTDIERSARIFTVGYDYCQKNDFLRCEELMKRAYQLNRSESRAVRLQAWASLQARAPDGTKMPDVGEVEPLSEFELEEFVKSEENP